MADIYDQHKAAFASVSAYVVLDDKGERVATVAFKYPRDGAGRLYCYLQIFGTSMVRDFAGGFGYAKHDAAIHKASRRIKLTGVPSYANLDATIAAFQGALKDSGYSWQHELREAGFTVHQAV